MPAAVAHYLLAKELLPELSAYGGKTKNEKDAFFWGAQGPDFLFCHRALPWMRGKSLKGYGSQLHEERPSVVLTAIAQFVHDQCTAAVIFYAMGFFAHYLFDRTAHPYINFWVEKKKSQLPERYTEDMLHNFLESQLDVVMARQMEGITAGELDIAATVPQNAEVQAMIARLYSLLCRDCLHRRAEEKELMQATEDCRKTFRFLTDPSGWKRTMIGGAERLTGQGIPVTCHIRGKGGGEDYANQKGERWYYPQAPEKISSFSFLDLFREARRQFLALLPEFARQWKRPSLEGMKELTGDLSFETGLPVENG